MAISDDDFIAAWVKSGGSPKGTANLLDIAERNVYRRRDRMAKRGVVLPTLSPNAKPEWSDRWRQVFENVRDIEVHDGTVIVFSDAHWWPDIRTIAHEALLAAIRNLKPSVIIANGDLIDGASTNRHDPAGWSSRPTVKEEIETVDANLNEIRLAAPKGTKCFWTIGNHDLNFERRLATHAPQYEGVPGMRLRDHFPDWQMQWAIQINKAVVVKHRWHNGVHGAYNNTLKSGRTIVTGHLHRLCITPWADYNGRRWGVDTGTLSHPDAPTFEYTEWNPKNWCSGFAVLTFKGGELLPPELCEVIGDKAFFRGEIIYGV